MAYYKPEYVHSSRFKDYDVTDEVYDAAEVRYLTLVRLLREANGTPNYPVNSNVHKAWPGFEDVGTSDAMMEVDMKRPSVQLVCQKLSSPKKRTRKRKT